MTTRFSIAACLSIFVPALLILPACGSDASEGSSGSSSKSAAVAAPQKPGLAIRSDYYTAAVEAELKAAGFSAADFRKGQRLYELYYMNCHAKPKQGGGPNPSKRLAPPAFAVANHYRRGIPDTRERVAAIASFTAKPSQEDALMPGAVEKFGLMGPMPLSEEQLQQISVFLGTGKCEKPGWYDQHYEEEHGPQG